MTSTLFKLSLAGALFCACQTDSYHIKGFARELQQGDTICFVTDDKPERILGQAIVNEGTFSVNGTTDTNLMFRAYLKRMPECNVAFFLEPGNIALELNLPPRPSRVSGTMLNNGWQQMNDSVQRFGEQLITLSKDVGITTQDTHRSRLYTIDSLHRRMSACIINTARRNHGNALGRYIEENYKEPEFK